MHEHIDICESQRLRFRLRTMFLLVVLFAVVLAVGVSGVSAPPQTVKVRRYSDEFKRDAVRLITEERYKFKAAAQAVGVSEKSLRDWHRKLVPPAAPCGEDASLATQLVSDALRQAIESRRPDGKRLLHHSDRGCQYTSDAYQQTLRTLGITCSMSRTGDCYDNAAMERFFWSLKHEWTNHDTFANLQDVRLSVFKYIETFYNPVRIHQTLGYLTPDEYEAENAPVQAA